jgi:GPI transamidase subunit PIG-U
LSRLSLFAVLALINLVLNVAILPYHYNFRHYACGDAGSSLLATQMVSQGVTPWLDFNYYYGFGTLWLNQAWFGLWGYTPLANYALNFLWLLLVAWGTASMVFAMGWQRNRVLLGIVLVTSPYLFCFCWFTTAHTLEAALVILTLSYALQRRYAESLLLATLALVVKPSIAYFVGLAVVIFMVLDRGEEPWRKHWWKVMMQMLPALVVLVAYTVYVLVRWGPEVLLNSVVPLSAMAGYEESACGFFRRGAMFWLPQGKSAMQLVEYYLLTPAGLWVGATVFLSYHLMLSLLAWLRTRTLNVTDRCIVLGAGLHLVFCFVLFGNEWSWTYEPYLLLFGCAAVVSKWTKVSVSLIPIMGCLVVCSLLPLVESTVSAWSQSSSIPGRHHLFMPRVLAAELTHVEQMARSKRMLFLTRQGMPILLAEGVCCVPTWAFMRYSRRDAERQGLEQEVAQAQLIVIPALPHITMMTSWPEVAEAMKGFRLVTTTAGFEYWQR